MTEFIEFVDPKSAAAAISEFHDSFFGDIPPEDAKPGKRARNTQPNGQVPIVVREDRGEYEAVNERSSVHRV